MDGSIGGLFLLVNRYFTSQSMGAGDAVGRCIRPRSIQGPDKGDRHSFPIEMM
jgi:hypothetical protein